MKEMSLQSVVNNVINSLIRSGEFSDRVELVTLLLSIIYLYDHHPFIVEEVLGKEDVNRLRDLFNSEQNLRRIDVHLSLDISGCKLLLRAVSSLLSAYRNSKELVIDSILSTITMGAIGKHQGIDTEPTEIAHLIAYLAKYMGIESVYDPFAGLASYATSPEFNGISFRGSELSIAAANIANLRLALNGQPMTVERMDSLRNWNHISFDEALITVPPYGMSLKDYDFYMETSRKRSEDFILDEIIERNDIRKAIVLLPLHRFASSFENEASRKYLVETGILEMVISLPSNSLFGTMIPTAIVIIDKDRSEEDGDKVTFISLIDCVLSDAKGRSRLNLSKAKQLISSKDGKYAVTVVWSEILGHHFSGLNPGEYLLDKVLSKENENRPYHALFGLVREKKSSIPSLGNKKTVIGLKDLEDEYSFSKEGVKPTTVISSRYYEITEPTILVSMSSSRFKVGIAYPKNGPLPVSAEIASIKIDDFWINHEYLVLELTKPYVQEQIRLLGYNQSPIKVDMALEKILIANPPQDLQKEIVNKAKDSKLAKYQHLISTSQRNFRRDVHMKRHAMGQTIQTIGNWWNVLETARSGGELINEEALIDGCDITLGEVLANIKNCIARVKVQVDKLDRGYKATPINLDLIEFLETYKTTHKSPVFHYSSLDYEDNIDEIGQNKPQFRVLFPSEVLTMILNNIVSNACSHGFDNEASKANIIKMGIENIGEGYVLSISNNGKPCSPDMTPEQIVKYGESSNLKLHCGIGGYEINQLITDFGGSLEIILDAGDEFPVEYRLTFKSFDK